MPPRFYRVKQTITILMMIYICVQNHYGYKVFIVRSKCKYSIDSLYVEKVSVLFMPWKVIYKFLKLFAAFIILYPVIKVDWLAYNYLGSIKELLLKD